MENMNDFMKNVKGLSKNPLGIIALFVSLIYGFACIVLGVSLNNMSLANERLPLIWFIIVFPVVILLAFLYLVVKHHEKLYAPSDFRDDDAFIKAMDKNDVQNKLDMEVDSLRNVLEVDCDTDMHSEEGQESLGESNKFIEKSIVKSISRTTSVELRLRNAKTWALHEFCLVHNYAMLRNQRIVDHGGISFELDGIVKNKEFLLAVEVKYFADSRFNNDLKLKVQEFIWYLHEIRNVSMGDRFRLIPVFLIVLDALSDRMKTEITKLVQQVDAEMMIAFYDYGDLHKKYGNS